VIVGELLQVFKLDVTALQLQLIVLLQ